jgi:putative pyruvate formate lyase activating enzyme
MGADNINLVNPTHYVREIAEAFKIYRPDIPVVYNTHGYEKISTLELADKFTDIYLPDLKFIDPMLSKRYTGKSNYAEFALPAIEYMAKKPATFSPEGKMLTGCIVRHLILPLAAYDSINIVKFVAGLKGDVYFIQNYKELQRKITDREYKKVLAAVEECGLERVFLQDKNSADEGFIPKWDY